MSQTWQNDNQNNVDPDFGSFDPNLGPHFFRGFYLH